MLADLNLKLISNDNVLSVKWWNLCWLSMGNCCWKYHGFLFNQPA